MNFIYDKLLIAFSVLIWFACNTQPTSTDEAKSEFSYVGIFNGENLDGWTMKIVGHEVGENFGNTFRVEDGILKIRYDQYGDHFNDRFGAIYTDKLYKSYRLKVEYRFVGETAPGAPDWGYRDSGIQFHSQSPQSMDMNQAFPICLEYNLHGGNGTDERPIGQICANGMTVEIDGELNKSYCTQAHVLKTFHGDQWVTLEIDVKDSVITHFVNGEKILTYSNPRYNSEHELGKTFIEGDDDRVIEGCISLQSNSHPIDFRKIEISEYE